MTLLTRSYLLVMALISAMSIVSLVGAQSAVITSTLCGVIDNVRTVVGVIALVLFILGGVLYAVAHMLPAAGNLRGNLQGWSLGMIVGGIVGLIIVILAPSVIADISSAGGLPTVPTSC